MEIPSSDCSHSARPEIILDLICPAVECFGPIVHEDEILPEGVRLPSGNDAVGHVVDSPSGPVERTHRSDHNAVKNERFDWRFEISAQEIKILCCERRAEAIDIANQSLQSFEEQAVKAFL